MERLRAQTKETVHLALRRGFQAVFIERLQGESTHALAIKLGGVLPLHVGASPRALLAFEPELFRDVYFAATTIETRTESAPATEAQVREILVEIRHTGASISDGDVVPGVATVGAPVFDHRGVIRAAIALNLLPEVLRTDRAGCVELARTAAAAASLTFGYDLNEKGLPTTP